jgi:transposase
MMKAPYSEAFQEQALEKVYERGNRSIRAVASDLNVSYYTLKGWMKKMGTPPPLGRPPREQRPADWTLEDRLTALQESHGLAGEALQAWCRERGLFVHHLAEWKAAFCQGVSGGTESRATLRALKEDNQRLARELTRKEKALAETAALLVLQKKSQALWGDEVA